VGLFLRLNGHRLNATPAAATVAMMDVAAGTLNEADFADWIRRHSAPVSSPPAQR
jgi:death-on-curing protein